ncbi:MDR family MFS transporter [Litchfieldia alkalitelluris]|uniref:MDR family MFS transporter n=1 Tax=Litchfieldia alkalitelluris TaxID=304268 RepID=UPI000997C73C|nr:MDR family MFS transporter [Litchfieldia alkalitelluris]
MEHLEQKKKVVIMIAIMAAMLFAALNQTIVGTALPRIIAELGGMEYFSWVFTIYMLASSITAILVGKLSDIYGRKPFILIGIGIFIVGSFLAGLAESIGQLIAFRAIQGLGGGMIMSTAFTAVGDLFAPRERGRWQGIMSGVFGLASVFGPTLGGWIVDNTDWHWIFWVFLPVGVIAFLMIMFMFPATVRKETEPVDYFGSLFLTLTIIPMLLAFSWGGTQYPWASFQIISLLIATVIALTIFIMIEKRVKSPVLPLPLFKNSIFTISNMVGFLQGAGMFGAIMYMPFFVQGVIGTSATASGLVMMPMTLSMVIASTIGGSLITKTGKYKKMALLGLTIMAAGMTSMTFMGTHSTNFIAVIHMIIVGIGLGISFPVFTLTIQNAVEQKLLGVATASSQLFRQIGGTVGVAIMGTIMATRMQTKMEDLSAESGLNLESVSDLDPSVAASIEKMQNPQVLMDPNQLAEIKASLPDQMNGVFDQLVSMLREALSYSLTGVFLIGGIIVGSAILLTLFLQEIPLRQSNEDPEQETEDQSSLTVAKSTSKP